MELVQTLVNAVVVGAVGIVLGFMVHGLRTEVRGDLAEIRRELADLRSDLTHVALAVGARPRARDG